ncbi:MAG: S-layer homology domain-containing protein [Clostridiales Family XIII bacterium]|jgi:hypothetical protein|nr:S-layer homology domain-containing protein [Clostridiales Family XIII bacterium]
MFTNKIRRFLSTLTVAVLLASLLPGTAMNGFFGVATAAAETMAPAASDAGAINGFVTDISFYRQKELNPIPGIFFDQATTSYDLTVPDFVTGANMVVSVRDEDLSYAIYYDGYKIKTEDQWGVVKSISADKAFSATGWATIATSPIGTTKTLTVQVGEYDEDKDEWTRSDVYRYDISRSLSLKPADLSKELEKPDKNNKTILHVEYGNSDVSTTSGAYKATSPSSKNPAEVMGVYDYTLVVPEGTNTVFLSVTPHTSSAQVYLGNENAGAAKWVRKAIPLAEYTAEGSPMADIPFTLRYNGVETQYHLYVGTKDYFPKVKKLEDITTEKSDVHPLTVELADDDAGGGELSYRWYSNAINPIEGATSATYLPDRTYAGVFHPWCRVTRTVNGVKFITDTNSAKVTVNRTWLTAPAFKKQPSSERTVYYENENPLILFNIPGGRGDNSEGNEAVEGAPYTFAVYRNPTKSVEITGETEQVAFENIGTGTGSGAFQIFKLAAQPAGTWYYWIAVTVNDPDGTLASDTRNSAPLRLTVKSATDVVTGLEGSGSADSPFLLRDAEDLAYVADLVAGTNKSGRNGTGHLFDMNGQVLAFAADITLPQDWLPIGGLTDRDVAEIGYDFRDYSRGDTDGAYEQEGDAGKTILPFGGVIDGKDPDTGEIHTLTVADHGKPLIFYAREATVKNLDLYGEHIDGDGLVYRYIVDYGPDGDYGRTPTTITIDNVTIKSGTRILRSGFLGGYASGLNHVNINNCTVEEGVVIGYAKDQYGIGSFGGEFNGTITNSVSYATVYGTDYVGGLIGRKGQSMGSCDVLNSAFLGTVEAAGAGAGGIIGGGYPAASGTPVVQIHNCYVAADIKGADWVGGILGAEAGHSNNVDEGDLYGVRGTTALSDNHFYGTVKATTGGNVGGVVGYYVDFTKRKDEAGNYYLDTSGATRAIGGVERGEVVGDDRLGKSATAEQFADGTVLAWLNAGTYKNWTQGEAYPTLDSGKVVMVNLNVTALPAKTQYYIGDELDLTGLEITANFSDGKSEIIPTEKVTVSGYDNTSRAVQTLLAIYNGLSASFDVTVLKKPTGGDAGTPASDTITVYFTLLGAPVHDSEADGIFYLKKSGNLETWIARKSFTVDLNARVVDVFKQALAEAGLSYKIRDQNNYIWSITRNGATLEEFTNGRNSGWQYTLNGRYSLLGVGEQFLENGDSIVFHYTDDWTKDDAADTVDPDGAWRPDSAAKADESAGAGASLPAVEIEAKTAVTDGKASAALEKSDIDAAMAKAKEEKTEAVSVTVKGDANTKSAGVTLPKSSAKDLGDSGLALVVKSPVGEVSLGKDALTAIAAKPGDALEIAIADEGKSDALAANNKEFTLTVKVGGAELKELGGVVAVALPYAKPAEEDAELLTVYDESGKEIKGAAYENGRLRFETESAGKFTVCEWISPFADIEKGAWYYKSIRYAYSNELVKGVGEAAFAPQATLTRAMLVTILARESGAEADEAGGGADGGAWYDKALEWGVQSGLTDGTNPNGEITREQFAVMLHRHAGEPKADGGLGAYGDAENVSGWAKEAMAWAVSTGLIGGRTASELAPDGTATRAEAATMLQRYMER